MNLALKNLELAGEIQGPPHCLNSPSSAYFQVDRIIETKYNQETKGVRGKKKP